jgi:peroxiredoxin Q/BCP
VKRQTFVIDTDRTIRKIITGELRAAVHADEALNYLRTR